MPESVDFQPEERSMFCRNCGKEVNAQAVACPACGVPPLLENKHCQGCGTATQPNQAMCTQCGVALAFRQSATESKKIAAGVLALLLNGLGIHKFYLGYTMEGVIMLLVTVAGGIATCGATAAIMAVVGTVEGIIYLTKTDADFERTYVVGRRGWF
jgi:TM2 domain-containing membrane protein YozV